MLILVFYPDYVPLPWHTVLACWATWVPAFRFPLEENKLIIRILLLGVIAILGQRYLPYVDVSFSIAVCCNAI